MSISSLEECDTFNWSGNFKWRFFLLFWNSSCLIKVIVHESCIVGKKFRQPALTLKGKIPPCTFLDFPHCYKYYNLLKIWILSMKLVLQSYQLPTILSFICPGILCYAENCLILPPDITKSVGWHFCQAQPKLTSQSPAKLGWDNLNITTVGNLHPTAYNLRHIPRMVVLRSYTELQLARNW